MDAEPDPMLMEALMLFSSEDSADDSGSADAERRPATNSNSTAVGQAPDSNTKAAPTKRRRASSRPFKPPRRRKRSGKCTYAARREEVARLRSLAAQLETQCQELHQDHHRRQLLARQRAQHEYTLLVQSQHENARLRGLLAAGEARIRAAQQAQQLM